MNNTKASVPMWFWSITVISLLWNIMGVFSFMAHTFITDSALQSLPQEEQALYTDYPLWTSIVFAIAVFTGLLGSISLIARKKISLILFQISLITILIQMTHNVFFTNSKAVYGLMQTIIMPIVVIVYGVFLVWFSKLAISKNWLK